jgi:hypothetical protein
MVDCPFRDIRRMSRHGVRYVEQVCSIGYKGSVRIGENVDEANTRFCSRCEVPTVMSTEHCRYLIPINHFSMGRHFRTSYQCKLWNEALGNSKEALKRCKTCDDYKPI